METRLVRYNDTSRHANGALGIWTTLSRNPEHRADKYGKYLYEFEMELFASQIVSIPLSDLSLLSMKTCQLERHEAEDVYEAQRNEWLGHGYAFVKLLERDSYNRKVVAQGIILSEHLLKSWRLIDGPAT